MSFALVDSLRVQWPVTITRPSDTVAGDVVRETFTGHFDILSDDELRAIDDRFKASPLEDRRGHEHDLLYRVLVGWDGVISGSSPVPFTPDNLKIAMRFPWFAVGVYAAYRELVSGEKARLGN